MMSISAPIDIYNERLQLLNVQLKHLIHKKSLIGWARFICVSLAIGGFYYFLPSGIGVALMVALIPVLIFLMLVMIAADNQQRINRLQLLVEVNQEEIKVSQGDFIHRYDGASLLPDLHDYAMDLDIAGRASLYQYVNRCTSQQGKNRLMSWLLSPASNEVILERQEAVKELSQLYEWRQQLQAIGMKADIDVATEKKLAEWCQEKNTFLPSKKWKWLRWVLPAFIITALLFNIAGLLPSPIFYGLVFVFFLISGAITRKVMPAYQQLDKAVQQIKTLSESLACIEGQRFTSSFLTDIQQVSLSSSTRASKELRRLRKILDNMDIRLNPFIFIPLNIFLFWDLQQILALEKWKEKNNTIVIKWFYLLAEMEAISTLANLHFNHPHWVFPLMEQGQGHFSARGLGHPLIAENKRVSSSFSINGKPQIALITGSNMAGKSTFLRSVGINMILALAGAPVCALECRLSNMRVISTMRITDNLEESTSTFYAELKKLKYIIEAVNRMEPVFLLLDEILRGTNSLDRHTGSYALINQLIRRDACGIIATHDLELARSTEKYPGMIHNYHFDVQVEKEELYFDYKLKSGVCTSLNASILMKKIGIEL